MANPTGHTEETVTGQCDLHERGFHDLFPPLVVANEPLEGIYSDDHPLATWGPNKFVGNPLPPQGNRQVVEFRVGKARADLESIDGQYLEGKGPSAKSAHIEIEKTFEGGASFVIPGKR